MTKIIQHVNEVYTKLYISKYVTGICFPLGFCNNHHGDFHTAGWLALGWSTLYGT